MKKNIFKLSLFITFALMCLSAALICAGATEGSETAYPITGYVMITDDAGNAANAGGEVNDARFSLSEDGTLTITATNSTELLIGKTDWNAENLEKAIPWYKHRQNIKKVVVDADITYIDAYVFDGLSVCKSIEFRDGTIKLGGTMIFAYCTELDTLGVTGRLEDGVIDLRNFTGSSNQAFENCSANKSVTVLMPYTGESPITNAKEFADSAKVTLKVLKHSPCETMADKMIARSQDPTYKDNFADVVNKEYYTEGIISDAVKGTYKVNNVATECDAFSWTLDLSNMHLYINNDWPKAAWEQLDVHNSTFQAFKNAWDPYILSIEVDRFEKIYLSGNARNLCQGMIRLESAEFAASQRIGSSIADKDKDGVIIGGRGLFEGCAALSSVTFGGVPESGVADLSGMVCNKDDGSAYYTLDLFNGCESIRKVIFPTHEIYNKIDSTCFIGCTSLELVTIPHTVTVIDEGAFDDAGSIIFTLTGKTTLTATDFPSGCSVIFADSFPISGGIVFDGLKIRTAEYNGIRGVFYYEKNTANEGYTLCEYGALVTPSVKKEGIYIGYSAGKSASSIPNFYPIYTSDGNGAGSVTGKILDPNSSDVKNKSNTYFAISITKYIDDYFCDEIYMMGYEIWKHEESGNYTILYTDYGTDESHNAYYIDTSIYELSLGMYKNGIINQEGYEDTIVWDVLKKGGGVTLIKDTHYSLTDKFTTVDAPAVNMLTGEPFGNEFPAVEVPLVNQSTKTIDSALTLTFAESGVTYTLLKDVNEGEGKYVLVYRLDENDSTKGTLIPRTNIYGTGYNSQLSHDWYTRDQVTKKGITAVAQARPNPLFKNNIYSNVSCAVIDYGITGADGETFSSCGASTYVYSSSFKTLSSGAFQNTGSNLKTMFKAGTDKVEGRVELSTLSSVGSSYTFNGCGGIVELHLPLNMSFSTQLCQKTSNLTTLWLGDAKPQIGTIDLSNATSNFSSIGDKAFTLSPATRIILPRSVTSINSTAFTNSGIATITQITDTAVEAIKTFAENNGMTYEAVETLSDWSGIVIE